jgi:DNA-binding LytR/AlgR family response regulator
VWLLTTPVVFAGCRKYAQRWVAEGHTRTVELVSFGVVVIFVSAAVPVAIDLLTDQRDAASSLMIFLPRYIAVMGVVYLIWHAFLREHPRVERAETAAPTTLEPIPAPEPEPPATLLVSKGADQCLIQISRIECASAAGNYVEIVERGQRYLMRATLKQMEDMLPAADFIRIHRSHLVRRDEIERIKTQPSGNGTVHLRGGQVLPLSKKHRQELQRYRPAD